MRTVERATTDPWYRDPVPATFKRFNAAAAILAGICLLGLAVIILWAFVVLLGLIFSPDAWSSVMRVE